MIVPEGWTGVRNIDKKLDPPVIDMTNKEEEDDQDISAEVAVTQLWLKFK